MNTLKYFIVFSLLFLISEISQAQRNQPLRQSFTKPNQESEELQGSTDSAKPTTNPSEQCALLFTQVFTKPPGKYDLIKAVLAGDLERVQLLIPIVGTDMNAEDRDIFFSRRRKSGWTPLMYATHRDDLSDDLSIALFLVKSGVGVNYENRYAMTALMEAAHSDNVAGIEFLLNSRADINQQNKHGMTALMAATTSGNMNAISFLVRSANMDLKNNTQGATALIIAAMMGYTEVARLLISSDGVMNLNLRDKKGWTALMHAFKVNLKLFELLKKHGAIMTPEDEKEISYKDPYQ